MIFIIRHYFKLLTIKQIFFFNKIQRICFVFLKTKFKHKDYAIIKKMPQFDISSFIVQLVWLFFSFLTFYILFSWKYLPSWAFLLKTRLKLQSTKNIRTITFVNYNLNNLIKNSILSNNTKNPVYF